MGHQKKLEDILYLWMGGLNIVKILLLYQTDTYILGNPIQMQQCFGENYLNDYSIYLEGEKNHSNKSKNSQEYLEERNYDGDLLC